MSYVNLKEIERLIEHRIMMLINAQPERGASIITIHNYFHVVGPQAEILKTDIPMWECLSKTKQMNRINKVIRFMIKTRRVKLVGASNETLDPDKPRPYSFAGHGGRLLPIHVLDRIVYAVEQEGSS